MPAREQFYISAPVRVFTNRNNSLIMDYFSSQRISFVQTGNIYFWTATINNWYKLLLENTPKQIVIDSLAYLSGKNKIDVYSFVIMPNHIHLIWRVNERNGKETAQGSFLKFTAHSFKKYLVENDPLFLRRFTVNASNKRYEFWQRDPMAIHLYKKEVALQKLFYIHSNPLSKHWNLCSDPIQYAYSSARFYETGVDDFGFLKHLMEAF